MAAVTVTDFSTQGILTLDRWVLHTMLRKTGTGWEFEHEALLEDFVQRCLQTLLGLKVIAQQHPING